MKNKLFILFLLVVIPSLLFGQAVKVYHGGLIHNGTIDSDAYKDGSIDDEHLSTTAVDGGNMLEATRQIWFPASADSSANDGWVASGGWTFDTSNPPSVEVVGTAGTGQIKTFIFDADGGSTGDDICYLSFVVPDDYETDSMELYVYFFHLDDNGGATDTVAFDGTVQAVAEGEDLFAAGTGMTVAYETCAQSDSALYVLNIDPEVEVITAGDHLTIQLFVDESASQLDSGEHVHLIGVLVEYEAKDE